MRKKTMTFVAEAELLEREQKLAQALGVPLSEIIRRSLLIAEPTLRKSIRYARGVRRDEANEQD